MAEQPRSAKVYLLTLYAPLRRDTNTSLAFRRFGRILKVGRCGRFCQNPPAAMRLPIEHHAAMTIRSRLFLSTYPPALTSNLNPHPPPQPQPHPLLTTTHLPHSPVSRRHPSSWFSSSLSGSSPSRPSLPSVWRFPNKSSVVVPSMPRPSS